MDTISRATEPFWQTPMAVLDVLGSANAGTLLFSLFLFIAALELLRGSSGVVAAFARIIAVVALVMASATAVYGDYLAPPATAMLTRIGLQERHQDQALVAVLGVAAMGVAYGAGRFEAGPQIVKFERARSFGWGRALQSGTPVHSVSERLQSRLATHNPKRPVQRTYRGPRQLRG
ncbi:MAG: hypothetical protein KBA31_06540 [Alphaproteobacteria bacterium]|nr:hypothetical protein [Alphaproteobacteria bacterium]